MNYSNSFKLGALVLAGALTTACQPSGEADKDAPLVLESDKAKSSYAIGASSGKAMANNLKSLEGTGIEVDTEILIQAFADGLRDTTQMDDEALQQAMTTFREQVNTAMQEKRQQEQAEQAKIAEENKTKGAEFLSSNKEQEGVVTLESGLQYKILQQGEGASPAATDRVKVHYKGTLIDGTQFDSSYDRNQPATFGVTQVIKGWTEALQLMKEGAKWQLFIPAELAYGPTPRPGIPGNSVLLFDVELLEVVAADSQENGANQ